MSWTAPCLGFLLAAQPLLLAAGAADNRQSSAIKVYDVTDLPDEVEGFSEMVASRKVFHFIVPAGGSITVALEHPRKALLELTMATLAEWQGRRQTRWQNRIPLDGRCAFTNKGEAPEDLFFVVADPREVSSPAEPYRLRITRSWKAPAAR